MSAVLAPNFQDEQILFTPNEGEIAREATRYLFNPADLITDRRKFDFKGGDRAAGGEEVTSPCLWRTRRFLRRGRITPLEVGPEWHTKDELDESSREQALRAGRVQHDPNNGRVTFYGVNVYPGDEIAALTGSDDTNGGFSRGVTEITALAKRDWRHDSDSYGDSEMYDLQLLFFPEYPALPKTLNALQALILEAPSRENRTAFPDYQISEMAEEMSAACDNFRLWGTNFVEMENQRIQAKVSVAGFVHTYTDMARVIMAQLEIEPLTIAQHKQVAAQASAADIGAAVAAAMKKPDENPKALDTLRAAIAEDPDGFKALFAELMPKNKGGRPKKDEAEAGGE
jgi:hypothetical protein